MSDGDALFDRLYGELRSLAERHLAAERTDHTLQPTALVHEAWLKLSAQSNAPEGGRGQFLAVASQAMRRILVDHARGKKRVKRGDGAARIELDDALDPGAPGDSLDLVALDEALDALADVSERQARAVELRFFGGLSVEDAADVLDVSPRTLEREWRVARAWLLARLRVD